MIKEKIRKKHGFTLSETLITIALLLIVSGIVVAGIPVAVNAYKKVVQAANAQVLLSTTLTELRDKLAFSDNVGININKTSVSFRGEDGRFYSIFNQTIGSEKGIYLSDDTAENVEDDDENVSSRLLVSDEAATRELYVRFKDITYEANKPNLITFNEVKVYRKSDDKEFAYVEKYDIELMNNEKAH